ncbi:hypothetical protein DRW48_04860 [Paracoccus suum]|uniref:Uncharacterized protein n=1 Tax=Paracoccus suum TaxID=2259340 RepID=A0A344PI98_9RHOB|nr:hypothetical protein [Paracoccus suum]AXC49103.1 hypothetical protein DRW48_04860 [Paracoccus suum]
MTFTPDDTRNPPHYRHGEGIDRSQETYEPSPHPSRRTPPSGKVTPNGKRAYPRPSQSAKLLIWGGMGVAAAALTAGTILGVRAVVDAIAGDEHDDEIEAARRRARARGRFGRGPRPMPRNSFTGPRDSGSHDFSPRTARDDGEHTAARDAARREERAWIEQQRRRARAAHRPSVAGDFSNQIEDVTRTIRNALGTVTAAIEGFRSVSGQAGSILNEFRGAADTVRTMFDNNAAHPARPRAREADEMVDLRDRDPSQSRTHRL